MTLENKVILVTGGTGSFGQKFTELRFFIGDVRDRERVHWTFQRFDVVKCTAALKQVSTEALAEREGSWIWA